MDTNMVKKTTKKTTQGRRKIEIKKIEETSHRSVTFSKRRVGLFKKASELCVLTGAEIAIMVRSSCGRIYAFGHPSSDHVVSRYLTSTTGSLGPKKTTTTTAGPKPISIAEFNRQHAELSKKLEEKKKYDVVVESNMANNGVFWWDESIESFGLEEFVLSMEEMKTKVVTRVDDLKMIRSSSSNCIFDVSNQTEQIYQNMEYGAKSLVPSGMDFGQLC